MGDYKQRSLNPCYNILNLMVLILQSQSYSLYFLYIFLQLQSNNVNLLLSILQSQSFSFNLTVSIIHCRSCKFNLTISILQSHLTFLIIQSKAYSHNPTVTILQLVFFSGDSELVRRISALTSKSSSEQGRGGGVRGPRQHAPHGDQGYPPPGLYILHGNSLYS